MCKECAAHERARHICKANRRGGKKENAEKWAAVDWSLSNQAIADALRVSRMAVHHQRKKAQQRQAI